jgi:hypothetical protein
MKPGDVGIIDSNNEYHGHLLLLAASQNNGGKKIWVNLTFLDKSWANDPHFAMVKLLPAGSKIQLTV